MMIEDEVKERLEKDRSVFNDLTSYDGLERPQLRSLAKDILTSYRVFLRCIAEVCNRPDDYGNKNSTMNYMNSSLNDLEELAKKYETEKETA